MLADPARQGRCSHRLGPAPLFWALALASAATLGIAAPRSGASEVVVLNLGAFSLVGIILAVASRCEMYVARDGRATVTSAAPAGAADVSTGPDGGPVTFPPPGLPPAPAVVGAGIDPATSHFSGARSTN